MNKIGMVFLAFSIASLAPIEGAYGIQFSASGGGGTGGSGSVSMNIKAANSASVNSGMSINGAILNPTTRLIGATSLFKETHGVTDSTGKSASVYVNVANAPNGLTYSSQVLPGEGSVSAQPSVSAEQWLTVPKADSITAKSTSSYGALSSDVGLEETKGPSAGDFVTLSGYYGKAMASASSVSASQTATSGSANSIRIYGDAKDRSGSYSINTPLTGLSGGKAAFNALNDQSSAGTATQVTQLGHVNGAFTSKLTAGTITKTRTSNYGTDYDLNLVAKNSASGKSVSGLVGYYVNPATSANKIQEAINAAQSRDYIYVAAGTYRENVKIDKSLTLNGLNGAAKTFVDGQLAGSVFTIGQNLDVALSGLTIKNGKSSRGGGIYNSGRLAMTNGIISGNTATDFGGGIFNDGGSITLNSGAVISSNSCGGHGGGGGIYDYHGAITLNAGSQIINNLATNGGGIKSDSGTIVMNDGLVQGNSATLSDPKDNWGGGIYTDAAKLIVNGGSINGNTAKLGGGGICNDQGSTLVINGGTISNNVAQPTGNWGRGGGIYGDINQASTINGGSIFGNHAVLGGGIWADDGSSINLVSGSISGNVASSSGGGIRTYGSVTITGDKSIVRNNSPNQIV